MKNLKVLLCIETKNAKFNTFARQSLWPTIAMCIICCCNWWDRYVQCKNRLLLHFLLVYT